MTYSEVFGGGTINPAQRTYLSLVMSADVVLQWPIEQQIGGNNVAADIIDVTPNAAGLNIDFSDASQVSTGFTSLFTNVGANTVTVRDSAGSTIISLAAGTAWFIYLTDNSTAAGVWRTFQLGATVSVASAAALAGAGLKAIATTLNQTIPPTATSTTPINLVTADRAQLTIWEGGVGVLNLPAPGTVGSDWFTLVRNQGSGNLTLTPPSGTIDAAANIPLAPGGSCIIVTDGTDFYTIGLGAQTVGAFDFVEIDVSGSGNFTLTGVQLNRIAYRFIGTLTGARKIVVPATIQEYWVTNATVGAFALTIGTAAQVTSIEVTQNNSAILYCDGTNVVNSSSGTFAPPVSIGQGGTGATNAATALVNLGAVPTTREVNTQLLSGLIGGGDLSTDRDLEVDVDNLTTELTVDPAADTMAFYDDSASATRKAPVASIVDSYILTGSFVGTLTGVTAVVTGTINYIKIGDLVFMYVDSSILGTSNTNSMTITGAPAIVRPSVGSKGAVVNVLNGSSGGLAVASISGSTGVISFSLANVVGTEVLTSTIAFQNSGLKGIESNWGFWYVAP